MSRPPGPSNVLFGLVNVCRFARDPLGFLTSIGRSCGDLGHWTMGPQQAWLVNSPELIREVLVARHRLVDKDPQTIAVLKQLDGVGLVTSDGDLWVRQRRLLQPAFHPRRMGQYVESTAERTREFADTWNVAQPIDVARDMTRLTLNIIARLFFGVEQVGEVAQLGEAVRVLSQTFYWEASLPFRAPDWLPVPFVRRKQRAFRFIDDFVRRVIRERRDSGEDRGDLLSMLLLAVDEEGDQQGMSDQQARDEAVTMLMAGHDSTAAALAWTWWLIATHPPVEAAILSEVQAVTGDRSVTWSDVQNLRLTEAAIRESLRLYPPVWALFSRVPREPMQLGGHRIPAGARLFFSPWVTHRDPRFFPDPDRFIPDRFLPENADSIPQYGWIPFGAGPHRCIGELLALAEMVTIVATLIRRFRIEPLPGAPAAEPEPFLSLRPRGGLLMHVSRRSA